MKKVTARLRAERIRDWWADPKRAYIVHSDNLVAVIEQQIRAAMQSAVAADRRRRK